MKKISRIKALCLAGLFISAQCLWSQTSTRISLQNQGGDLHILTLENGFTVFVKEDYSSAIVHGNFMSRAGISCQTATTAGFFPLHSSLLQKRIKESRPSFYKTVSLESSCGEYSTSFSADMTASTLETFISSVSSAIISPQWTDAQIESQFSLMKKQVLSYEETVSGFINTSIDSRIFSESPWKHDSGVFPSLFAGYNTAEARTLLADISMRYYTPKNCALFITGNISRDNAYRLCQKYFGTWKSDFLNGDEIPLEKDIGNTVENTVAKTVEKIEPSAQRKFVITDDSFSTEMTQLAVQFTDLSLNQADILSAALNSSTSLYRKLELEDEAVAIRSRDYLAASSAQYNNRNRLILQTLMERPFSFSKSGRQNDSTVTPLEQTELFVSHAVDACKLDERTFDEARKEVESQYMLLTGSSLSAMQFLADFWAITPKAAPKEFYDRFLTLHENLMKENLSSLNDVLERTEPYVFVMLNTKVWEQYGKSFEDAGYERITRSNASWYRDQLIAAKALSVPEEERTVQEKDLFDEEDFSAAGKFYFENSLLISTDNLENGIPVVVRTVPSSSSVTVSIAIDGGEAASPKDQHGLRTILVNFMAVNLQQEISRLKAEGNLHGQGQVTATTADTRSYINISVQKDDLEAALNAASRAIIFGELLPVMADRLVYEQKSQWNQKTASMDYQMKAHAYTTMYKGTPLAQVYDIKTPLLEKTSYNSLTMAYTELLDASLYSIVICGGADGEEAVALCENSLGLLKEQTGKKTRQTYRPLLMPKTERPVIRHTFSTDKPAEDAHGVPILVPTKEFKDPVQFYFASPKDDSQTELFNAMLLELQQRVNMELGTQATCVVDMATRFMPFACVRTNAILHTQIYMNAYKKAVSSLKEDFKDRTEDDPETAELLENIKTRWCLMTLGKTQTNEGTAELIQQGLLTGSPTQFLSDFVSVQDATLVDVQNVLKYIPEDPTYKLYSESSKK